MGLTETFNFSYLLNIIAIILELPDTSPHGWPIGEKAE